MIREKDCCVTLLVLLSISSRRMRWSVRNFLGRCFSGRYSSGFLQTSLRNSEETLEKQFPNVHSLKVHMPVFIRQKTLIAYAIVRRLHVDDQWVNCHCLTEVTRAGLACLIDCWFWDKITLSLCAVRPSVLHKMFSFFTLLAVHWCKYCERPAAASKLFVILTNVCNDSRIFGKRFLMASFWDRDAIGLRLFKEN